MSENFKIVDVNPNDNVGGGGCLCSESKDTDCKGPFAVFYTTDMSSNVSPHPVIGAGCLRAAVAALDGEVLAGGEPTPEPPPAPEEPEEIEGDFVEEEVEEAPKPFYEQLDSGEPVPVL